MIKRVLVMMFLATSCSKAEPETKTEPAPVESAPAEPETPKTRAEALSYLRAKPKWLPNLNACPFDVMPKEILLTRYVEDLCKGEAIVGCTDRCAGGDPQACFALALEVQEPRGKSNPLSESLFLHACVHGEAGGCTARTAGRLVERDDEVDECTRSSFRRACDADDAWACAFLASAVATDSDRKELVRVADKACKLAPGVAPCQAAKQVLDAVRNQDVAAAQP